MLLLEIGYSEKYDTFTGYVCNQSEYYRYEVDKDKVELIPIGQEFNNCKDFVDKFSKSNPHARFLADPIEIKIPSKGKVVTQKEYNDIVKKKVEEMREMYGGKGRRGGMHIRG